jgi:hypothetical protein
MDAIDHVKECNGVLESLAETNMGIKYQKVQATLDKITKTLTDNPIAFHFSGHGTRKEGSKRSIDRFNISKDENFLVLEDKNG